MDELMDMVDGEPDRTGPDATGSNTNTTTSNPIHPTTTTTPHTSVMIPTLQYPPLTTRNTTGIDGLALSARSTSSVCSSISSSAPIDHYSSTLLIPPPPLYMTTTTASTTNNSNPFIPTHHEMEISTQMGGNSPILGPVVVKIVDFTPMQDHQVGGGTKVMICVCSDIPLSLRKHTIQVLFNNIFSNIRY